MQCIDFWLFWLADYPRQQFVSTIQSYLTHGIDICYKGPQLEIISPNWQSSMTFKQEVQAFIQENIQLGAVAGPLQHLPPGFGASPLGAFQRKNTKKVRVIHDLSWPPGNSVNDYISPSECSVSYVTVQHAADLCLMYQQPWLVKMDIKAAFLSFPVVQKDTKLLGFQFHDYEGLMQYYNFQALPFGMCSSARKFDDLAKGLLYIMIKRGVPSTVVQYLDDFCCVAGTQQEAQEALDLMVDTTLKAGFRVQPEKTQGPNRSIEFLGILIDTHTCTLSISQERMQEMIQLLKEWEDKSQCLKRELLSLNGKLNFCSRVIRYGRMFTRRLIHLSKKVKNLHHTIKLTSEAKADIRWWLASIHSHNGITWLDDRWRHDLALYLQTDASNIALVINGW